MSEKGSNYVLSGAILQLLGMLASFTIFALFYLLHLNYYWTGWFDPGSPDYHPDIMAYWFITGVPIMIITAAQGVWSLITMLLWFRWFRHPGEHKIGIIIPGIISLILGIYNFYIFFILFMAGLMTYVTFMRGEYFKLLYPLTLKSTQLTQIAFFVFIRMNMIQVIFILISH